MPYQTERYQGPSQYTTSSASNLSEDQVYMSYQTGQYQGARYQAAPSTSYWGTMQSRNEETSDSESETLPENATEPMSTNTFQTGPKKAITDSDLYKMGARSQGLIKGTLGEAENLDSSKISIYK
jgi:hypothetical protein